MISKSEFTIDFNKRFITLSNKLSKLENELQATILKSIKGARASSLYWRQAEREITLIYAQIISNFDTWAKVEIPLRYKLSLIRIQNRIEASKTIISNAKYGITHMLNTNASAQIMQALYRTASESFGSACMLGRKNAFTFTRLTQQTLLREGFINLTIATEFGTGDLRRAADKLSASFYSKMLNVTKEKQFVQAGRYKYKPRYYSELVARTKFHDAHSEAALSEAKNYDTDLMQISSHNTTTKLCMDFEGKIFSVSGKDPRFPPLTDTPPYHPNCLHLMFPAFEDAMKVQGTFESFSAFSKGEIGRPPIPSGFIPVDQRALLLKVPGPIPKQVSVGAIKPTKETLPNLSTKKGAESVTKAFEKSPAALQKIVDGHADFNYDFLAAGKNGGSYNASTSTISIGKNIKAQNRFPSIRHEIGHHIDSRMGQGVISGRRYNWSNSGEFKTALRKDVNNILGDVKHRTALNKTLNGPKIGDSSLGDLFDAATQGKVKGYFNHGAAYYNRNPDMIFGESFANMTEIYGRSGKGGWNFLQKHLPETTRIYEQSVLKLGG